MGWIMKTKVRIWRQLFQVEENCIHANTRVNPLDRKGLERLVGYMARPAISEQRLSIENGQVVYQLKKVWSDGRTSVKYSPLAFLKRLSSLIPPPSTHLVRHSGVFAPAHKLRSQVAPHPEEKKVYEPKRQTKSADEPRKVKNTSWARMLKKVFEIDVGVCSQCGTEMVIVGTVHAPDEVKRYLQHVGLWPTGPPPSDEALQELTYLELVTP